MYLVNDSPWPVTTKLQLDISPGCRIEELSGRRQLPQLAGQTWTVPLQPFDLVAVRFMAPNVKIVHAETAFEPNVKPQLEARVLDLQQRVASLVGPPVIAIANGDFELPMKAGHIPGWTLTNPNGGSSAERNSDIRSRGKCSAAKTGGQTSGANSIARPESFRWSAIPSGRR